MAKFIYDEVSLNKLYSDFLAKFNLKQPWLMGLIARQQAIDVDKDNKIAISSMVGGLIDVMPSVADGNPAISVDSIKFKSSDVQLDHFMVKYDLDAAQIVQAKRLLEAINSGEVTDKTAEQVCLELYGKDYARARIAYNNKLTLMYYQLISNGQFTVANDTHNDSYAYLVPDYQTVSDTSTNFDADPISILSNLVDTHTSNGGSAKSILMGTAAAAAFINSTWAKDHMAQFTLSGFNYSPIKAINPTNATVQAVGVYDITDIGDVKVRKITTKLKVDGVIQDAFDPNAIICIDESNVGTLYTKATIRNKGNGEFIFDSADMSYYLADETDKHVTHKSEGFYVTAITQPENLTKLILS